MDGLIIKYEWLSHDFLFLRKGFHNTNRHLPMLFDCSNLTLKYQLPEGHSLYGSYIGVVGNKEFEFASLNLEKTTKEKADEELKNFFMSRPSDAN